MLAQVVQEAFDAYQQGEADIRTAIVSAAVNAWYEGHVEGEDACEGCSFRGDDPELAEVFRRYRG